MRNVIVGALLAASLVIGAMAGRSASQSATAYPVPGTTSAEPSVRQGGDLFTHVAATDGGPLTVTVVASSERVLAVYQVDRATGKITPKSVRNITWDLQMVEYNSGEPLPQDVRNGLKR
ncbi:MAG: hypothetical protein IT425_10775 [Pirellulales bacterium]|nr:hypothetical protein [Pirellulales bacterium]